MNKCSNLIRIDLPIQYAHILKLKALGDIFFPVDSKFAVKIELFSIENFSFKIYSTDARVTSKCSSTPKLKEAKKISLKNSHVNFYSKNSKMFNFFIESPLG